MSEPKLLPCPFCGEAPIRIGPNLIVCDTKECAANPGVRGKNGKDAIVRWNRRMP